MIQLGKTTAEIAKARYGKCKECKNFNLMLKTCKKCGCFMPIKCYIENAKCPINKWDQDWPTL